MGCCTQASSFLTKIELTTLSDVARYKYKGSPSIDFMSNRGVIKYFFSSSKDHRHSSIHEKSLDCYRVLKKERHLSTDLEMNRLSTMILPLSCCISFFKVGCFILMIAFIYSRFTLIFQCEMRKLKKNLAVTPKAHLVEFSFIWCRRSVSKASSKSRTWS